jgi:hypothetical protein
LSSYGPHPQTSTSLPIVVAWRTLNRVASAENAKPGLARAFRRPFRSDD